MLPTKSSQKVESTIDNVTGRVHERRILQSCAVNHTPAYRRARPHLRCALCRAAVPSVFLARNWHAPNARRLRVLRPGQIECLGHLAGQREASRNKHLRRFVPLSRCPAPPELFASCSPTPGILAERPNEPNGRKLTDYRALELPCRLQARPAMPNAVRSSRNPLRATSSGRTTALVLPAVLLPCSDEPKRTDNSASQSGARTCARRILRMVEPGSAAPTAAIALFGVGGWSCEVSRMSRFSASLGDAKLLAAQALVAVCPASLVQGLGTVGQLEGGPDINPSRPPRRHRPAAIQSVRIWHAGARRPGGAGLSTRIWCPLQ